MSMKLTALGLMVMVFAAGCETGLEVTGVDSATAARQADGTVVVDAKTSCDLKEGMGRADSSCDSDGDEACFRADWVEHDDPSKIVSTARLCKDVEHPRSGEIVRLASPAPIPTDRALDVRVYTEDGACVPELALEPRPKGCAVFIASPTK
jgi:hypothetical protein